MSTSSKVAVILIAAVAAVAEASDDTHALLRLAPDSAYLSVVVPAPAAREDDAIAFLSRLAPEGVDVAAQTFSSASRVFANVGVSGELVASVMRLFGPEFLASIPWEQCEQLTGGKVVAGHIQETYLSLKLAP